MPCSLKWTTIAMNYVSSDKRLKLESYLQKTEGICFSIKLIDLCYLLHFNQLLVKVQERLRAGDESVEIIKQTETQ